MVVSVSTLVQKRSTCVDVLVGERGGGIEASQPFLDVDGGGFHDVRRRALHRGVHRLALRLGGTGCVKQKSRNRFLKVNF